MTDLRTNTGTLRPQRDLRGAQLLWAATILALVLLLGLSLPLRAQKEFPTVWATKFEVGSGWNAVTPDLAFVLGGDDSGVEVLDGSTGKMLWNCVFKEKFGVRKCEDWIAHHDTRTVEVIVQRAKDAPLEHVHLDYATGAVLAKEDLPARERKVAPAAPASKGPRQRRVNHASTFDEASGTSIALAYNDKRVKSAMGGSKLDITVTASGGHAWSTTFEGRVVAHMVYDMLPADDGEVILDVSTGQGKVFVVYEGISCLDLATGRLLWSTSFDNTTTSVGLRAKQEIGRAAMPLPAADGVYIADLSKDVRAIKKVDINTGAVIWTGDRLQGDDIISELLLVGGNLVARTGGVVRHEIFVPNPNGGVGDGTYKVEHVFEGSTGLRAYDAATGKAVWSTEAMEFPDNFRKGECNILSDGGLIYALGDRNIHVFDAATGKVVKQGEYNSKTIGRAHRFEPFNGRFLIEGEKGIACVDQDLKPVYATNTGKCLLTEMRGDAFIVWTGKEAADRNEFIRFDPVTGAVLGGLKGCYRPRFDLTGDRFVRFDGDKVMLYRTN